MQTQLLLPTGPWAVVCPGQGSQTVGMGQLLAETSHGRQFFQAVDDTLGYSLSRLMWQGPAEELTRTQHAQPALLAVTLAAWQHLQHQQPGLAPQLVAGHSLGEYSAITLAGGFTLPTALKLVQARGQAMAQASGGAMAAVLGLTVEQTEAALASTPIVVANDNCPGQVVVAGPASALPAAEAALKTAGAKRVLPLNVSGAFHTAAMAPAAQAVAACLAQHPPQNLTIPCVLNTTAQPAVAAAVLTQQLIAQTTSRVRWQASMATLAAHGVTQVVELGSGKVLAGLASRCLPNVQTHSLESPASIDAWLETQFK